MVGRITIVYEINDEDELVEKATEIENALNFADVNVVAIEGPECVEDDNDEESDNEDNF